MMAQIKFDPVNGEPYYETDKGVRVPIKGPKRDALIKQRQQQQQPQQPQQQQPPRPPVNKDVARQKIAAARAEHQQVLRQLQQEKPNITAEDYKERLAELREDLDLEIFLIQQEHGIGGVTRIQPGRNERQLTPDQIDRALASTPIPGEPKQRQQFSNTSYRPQKNIYA